MTVPSDSAIRPKLNIDHSKPRKLDPNSKVAIVGFASSSRDLAPFADLECEVWSLNHAYTWIPRWTRWFEIHAETHIQKNQQRAGSLYAGDDHWNWLKRQPPVGDEKWGPIYMQQAHPDIPASIAWPRDEINAWFKSLAPKDGFHAWDYYTSSISEMIALAMYEGFGRIELYGIDLLQDDEYAYQRPGAEYLIGLARGMGHQVYVPKQSALCKANYTYGYTEPPFDGSKYETFWKYLDDKVSVSETNIMKATAELNTCDGAIQILRMLDKFLADGLKPDDAIKKLKEETNKLAGRVRAANEGIALLRGQQEAFKSSVIWGKHFERGGALEL